VLLEADASTPQTASSGSDEAIPTAFGEAAGEVVNMAALGMVLCSPSGAVVAANPAAAERLRKRDGLMREAGMLAAESPVDTAELRRSVKRTAETGVPDSLLIRRANGSPPLMAVTRAVGHGERRGVVVAMRDTGCRSPLFAPRIKAIFRLAPAEADIITQLALGSDLSEIAAARGVTINTIRTQMASAMLKVGVNRQAELVATIAAMDMPF
jgi:DNA-binding CsgD family transcriptional regulator